ncbi:MAG: polysaccharide pyruvyl transferase family protein [Lachnospiraceae bacterium]|nr:polysaccharide pyruvyl transferase family protein [Lachnospiraceae bacterium]
MKVALLTWFNEDRNCGQTLQAYALQHVFDSCYHCETIIVNYKYLNCKKIYLNNVLYKPYKIYHCIKHKYLKRQLVFDKFVKKYMNVTKYLFSKEKVEDYIIKNSIKNLILGSDQLWNPEAGTIPDVMLLNFSKATINKFAYSPSMCPVSKKSVYKNEIQRIASFLRDYKYIGVREKSAKEMISEFYKEKVINVLIDPVFLLSDKEWRNLFNLESDNEKYILIYCMGKIPESLYSCIDKIMEENSIQTIYYIETNERKKIPSSWKVLNYVGPIEFLKLIDNAYYVLGDSFHMVAFSLIFKKNFYVFPGIREKFIPNSDRIVSLLNIVDMDERFIDNNDLNLEVIDIDYNKKFIKVQEYIDYSKNQLDIIISMMND